MLTAVDVVFLAFCVASIVTAIGLGFDWFRLSQPSLGAYWAFLLYFAITGVRNDKVILAVSLVLGGSLISALNERDDEEVRWVL